MVRGRACAQPRHKTAGALSAHGGEDRGRALTWPSRPTPAAAWSSWITGKGRTSGNSFYGLQDALCPARTHTPPIPWALAPHASRGGAPPMQYCALVVAGLCAVDGTRAVLRPSSALRGLRAAPPLQSKLLLESQLSHENCRSFV